MTCQYCGAATKVTNSRPHTTTGRIWRRRQCVGCNRIWSTYEVPDYASMWWIDGEPFSRDQLFASLLASLGHRPQAVNDASALVITIIPMLYGLQTEGAIKGHDLAIVIAETLGRFDTAAATHYRAFHHL